MPRWKALPEELDPEIREFASQMRQLVDRSGLGLSALSDRTGYSKTSWERYLNGRLLPPQGAVSALAEVTGTDVRHLATMWELAERAWSRAEMRHDMTMEAIRISQAREALAAAGRSEDGRKKGRGRAHKATGRSAATVADRPTGQPVDAPTWAGGRGGAVADAPADAPSDAVRPDFDSTAVLRRQSAPADRTTPFDRPGTRPAPADRPAARPQPAPAAGGFSTESPGPSTAPSPPGPPNPPRPAGHDAGAPSRGRRIGMVLAGAVGALVVVAGAVFFLESGGEANAKPEPKPSPTKAAVKLPDGVKCSGGDCTGEDPELMGCGGQYAETSADAMVGTTYVEVRYSDVCKAAWARIGGASPGTKVTVSSAGESESDEVTEGTGGYTMMVAAKNAEAAKACVETATGTRGCTTTTP
ncbi:DUF2690 domain-containing protein [Streptomyces sp. OF3]|uniref:DUF2690 domain-containing protein n=1 Tax=Streptomyces alkaliterrae TaxID=2213162 RepID=A0A7W3WNN0_9ACTN|nr:DUF2690 domain-containing protein [Streptomyces alkaliterrae]MBB1255698.1 DUF2690 domain-containing protein [Streptomyces alkaliterrae]